LAQVGSVAGFPWFELACDVQAVEPVMTTLGGHCPGITTPMLEDLVTPDDSPEGAIYGDGSIRLASTFSVAAKRDDGPVERGRPRGTGVLEFQPVEILAAETWLISCWHPTRVYKGTDKIPGGPPGSADEVFRGAVERWHHGRHGSAGDLGVAVMNELALTYVPTVRELMTWLEDWELSLYVDDKIDSEDQLPELWGLMAMMRNWLTPLNRPGLHKDIGKAWLPVTEHDPVIEVDDRVDKALDELARLSETLRQSFGLLHVEQTEEQRQREEKSARRLETLAAVFLVPTLVVGFYGANTWVPGQNKHWGFWVMVAVLVILSFVTVLALRTGRRAGAAAERASAERARLTRDPLRDG
jgi:Mg2+ and Co2+ transporter CorA